MKIKKIMSATLLSLVSIGIGLMIGITGCSEGNNNVTASQEQNMEVLEKLEIDGLRIYKIKDKNTGTTSSSRYIYVVKGYTDYPVSISVTE